MEKLLIVTSPAFEHDGIIPIQYTGRGIDISPELHLEGIDARAESLAVIMDDLDHPIPGYNHWVIWNLPVMETIPEHIPHGVQSENPAGAVQGKGYGKHRYRGPRPPFNWSHRYRFTVYVLDAPLDIPVDSRKRHLLKAMEGHILQKGSLVGRYR